eukprot:1549670-Lingulodinium_polyedra.AAC.1
MARPATGRRRCMTEPTGLRALATCAPTAPPYAPRVYGPGAVPRVRHLAARPGTVHGPRPWQ